MKTRINRSMEIKIGNKKSENGQTKSWKELTLKMDKYLAASRKRSLAKLEG